MILYLCSSIANDSSEAFMITVFVLFVLMLASITIQTAFKINKLKGKQKDILENSSLPKNPFSVKVDE